MRSFLINKNLSLYYSLKRVIGKKRGIAVARTIEKTILVFGREELQRNSKQEIPAEGWKSRGLDSLELGGKIRI